MKCEVINIETGEVIHEGSTIKECKIWGQKNGFRSPQYYVRVKGKIKKKSNEDSWPSCVDQSDISNL